MRPAAKFCLLLAVSALTAFSIRSLMAQDAESQVKREVERLQRSLKEKPITDPDFAPVNNMAADGLKSAADALNNRQLYVSLERLNSASSLLQGARTGEEKAEAVKSGLPAFETEWGKASLQLTSLDQDARKQNWSKSPLAIRALAEAAQGRSIPLLDGSRGFATSTKPKDGLFYMGQSQAEAEFAKFCASLQVPHKPASLTLRSFLPEIQKLQDKTNAAFQPPQSIDQHSRFIALNSALKLAQELDSSKFYTGALYEYLDATRHYGMIEGAAVDPAKQAALKNAVAEAQKRFDASSQDDSIAQIFIERANSYLTHPDGSAPSSDESKAAQVILEQVLPAYKAAEKPAAPVQRASGKTVDITLVRWPYTWNISDPASLLVQEVAAKYPGQVTFVSENFGASKLAERFGVKGYPAIFVDDVLVAAPREFGYFGEVEGSGRYAPWKNADNQAKFKADLTRMIDLILAGKKDIVAREHPDTTAASREIAALPKFTLTDLAGKPLTTDQLKDRVVLVEFWATWCPPCRSTLEWLGDLKRKHGDKLAVVALAVESPEDQIRSTVASLSPDLRWAIADAKTAQGFGDITSVPTLFLFDRAGKTARVVYGAPPDLHQQAEKILESLVK